MYIFGISLPLLEFLDELGVHDFLEFILLGKRELLDHLADFLEYLLADFLRLNLRKFLDFAVPVDIEDVIHHVEPDEHLEAVVHKRVLLISWIAHLGGDQFQEVGVLAKDEEQLREALFRDGEQFLQRFMDDGEVLVLY